MIVAFLQNQWFHEPEKMERMLERQFKGDRPKFVKFWLFYRCLSGNRLMRAFGEDLVDRIIWENASPKIGGVSTAVFRADPMHMESVLYTHKPKIVLAFGNIAGAAIEKLVLERASFDAAHFEVITGPHPAARGPLVVSCLAKMASRTRELLEQHAKQS